jgi:hemerythrin
MLTLEWSASHAVFVTEMDDEHVEIFQSLAALETSLASKAQPAVIRKDSRALTARIDGHFAHEERLMRAARYGSYRWHKRLHDNARRRVVESVARLEDGDADAGPALIGYLTTWLHDHSRLADMMLGAFLRNHRRGLYKVTFRAGTKPIDACEWRDSKGEKFDPRSSG